MLLLVTLVNSLLWSAVLPFNSGNDENLHLETARFIGEHGRLPVFGPGKDAYAYFDQELGVARSSYALHPSLPYILGGFLIRLVPTRTDADILHAARLLSVAAAVATVLFASLTAQVLFPHHLLLRLAVPVLVAFQPQFTYITGYVNNDAFATAAASLVVWLTVRRLLAVPGEDWMGTVSLGVALGVVILSKFNVYPIMPFAVLGYGWSRRRQLWPMLRGLALVGLLALAVGGWWPLRNALLYHGDWLAMETSRTAWLAVDPAYQSYAEKGFGIGSVGLLGIWWIETFDTFWAAFGPGGRHVTLGRVFYLGFALIVLSSLQGLGRLLSQLPEKLKRRADQPRAIVFLGLALFTTGLLLLSLVNSFVNDYQPQGRYLFPALVPISILLAVGIAHFRLAAQSSGWPLLTTGVYFIATNLLGLWGYVLPAYYPGHGTGAEVLHAVAAGNAWFFPTPVLSALALLLFAGVALVVWSLLRAFQQASAGEHRRSDV
ncbi:MAG: hypothetical protein HY335_10435 [Deinococcus sp.]|nr:hypothetical protein [Deinococcus sp.]